MIAFTKTKLPFGWMGNMAPFPVVYDGKEWRTTEALFQALRFADQEIKEEIRQQRSPMGAKMVAKKHRDKMVVEPKSLQDLKNMDLCLRLKLEQHPDLKKKLLETGEEKIVEDVTKRPHGNNLFWGGAKQSDGTWSGANTLGHFWMFLRNELKLVKLDKFLCQKAIYRV